MKDNLQYLSILLVLIVSMLSAETFVVDTTLDIDDNTDLKLSLREAIAFANANGEDDVILFDAKVRKILIVDTLVIVNDADRELVINGPVTLDGGGLIQLFQLQDTAVRFNEVTFLEGLGLIANGGAVVIDATSQATFTNCFFDRCASVFSGGALQIEGTCDIINTSFSRTSALGNGGAINIGILANVEITNCDFSDCVVLGNGGAINNDGTLALVVNCLFQRNLANVDGDGSGGAIANNNIVGDIINCVFSKNRAGTDGGAYFDAGNAGGTTMSAVIFENNQTVVNNGGAINAQSGSDISIEDAVFTKNRGNFNGGAIFTDGTMAISDTTFLQNQSVQNNGGGIFADNTNNDATVTISECTFEKNRTNNQGGATYTNDNAVLQLVNCTISANQARNDGGGHFDDTAVSEFIFCTFTKNRSGVTGGGIAISAGSDVSLNSTIVEGNRSGVGDDLFGNNFTDDGFNLVEDPVGHNIADGGTNIVGRGDADLNALRNNGGATETHALRDNSQAIDNGDPGAGIAIDQRRFLRDANPDIGAFEFNAVEQQPALEFVAQIADDIEVTLHWQAIPDPRITGFNVWRKKTGQQKYTKINDVPILVQSLTDLENYTFTDRNLFDRSERNMCYLYQIEYIAANGKNRFSQRMIARTAAQMEKIQRILQNPRKWKKKKWMKWMK